MDLKKLKQKVKEFDKKTGFDNTEFSKMIAMIKEEVRILEANPNKKDIVNHELTDLLILLMQIAHRYDTDFDKELDKWFKNSKKYLKK